MRNDGSFWQKLVDAVESNYSMKASKAIKSHKTPTNESPQDENTYIVLDAQELDGQKLIEMKNCNEAIETADYWSKKDIKNIDILRRISQS